MGTASIGWCRAASYSGSGSHMRAGHRDANCSAWWRDAGEARRRGTQHAHAYCMQTVTKVTRWANFDILHFCASCCRAMRGRRRDSASAQSLVVFRDHFTRFSRVFLREAHSVGCAECASRKKTARETRKMVPKGTLLSKRRFFNHTSRICPIRAMTIAPGRAPEQ